MKHRVINIGLSESAVSVIILLTELNSVQADGF